MNDFASVEELARELFSSVRDLDCRVYELKLLISKGSELGKDANNHLRSRVKSLVNTRFCLVYSLLDIREKLLKSVGPESASFLSFEYFYANLKRQL